MSTRPSVADEVLHLAEAYGHIALTPCFGSAGGVVGWTVSLRPGEAGSSAAYLSEAIYREARRCCGEMGS